jgi:hypothetical protein
VKKPFIPLLAMAVFSLDAAAGVFSLFDPATADEAASISVSLQAFAADDPVSIHDFFNKWHGPYHDKQGENLAIDDVRADIGASVKNWGYFGYSYRHQLFAEASHDLARLAWQAFNDAGFDAGKEYDLSLSAEGYEADGLVYARRFPLLDEATHSFIVGFGLEYLHAYNCQSGRIDGSAIATSTKEYRFSATADYRYTKNYLYHLDVDQAKGNGITTHISLLYRYGRYSFSLIGNDIFGCIRWQHLPYSYVELNSQNRRYDENGYLVYDPTIKGVEKYIDYTQRLYSKWRIQGSFHISDPVTWSIGTDYVKETLFPYTVLSCRWDTDLTGNFSYESRFRSVGAGLSYRHFSLDLKSNGIDHSSAMSLSVTYRYLF